MMLAYFTCHLLGMSSSCSNPFIYAFLNDSFVAELRYLAIKLLRKLLRISVPQVTLYITLCIYISKTIAGIVNA
jgi:hypothetical protein